MEAALFGLAGVIIGVVLTWLGSAWSERSKRRHEGRILVRGEKLDAYSTFSAAAKDYMVVLYRVASGLGIDEQTENLTPVEAEPLLADALNERDRAFERIRLVGSDEVILRAREWVKQIYAMRNYLKSPEAGVASWRPLVEDANRARDRFHDQGRMELAVA